MQGWIKLHRELLDKPIWIESTYEQRVILITLLLMVNHKPTKWLWKGQLYECQAGQMITSLASIQKKCGKGMTRQKLRTALELFKNLEFLTIEATKRNSCITIVNYKTYQFIDDEINQQANQHLTNSQPTLNQHLTTNNNVNNVNNDNNVNKTIYTADFEKFWLIYPKKVGKGAAFASWQKIGVNNGLAEKILKAVEAQKTWPQWSRDEGQFIPYPATWLNQKRWDDENNISLFVTKTKAELSLEKIERERALQ